MNEANRKKWALRYRALLDAGKRKKEALFNVQEEIRAIDPKLPRSRRQIYAWCEKFGIDIR